MSWICKLWKHIQKCLKSTTFVITIIIRCPKWSRSETKSQYTILFWKQIWQIATLNFCKKSFDFFSWILEVKMYPFDKSRLQIWVSRDYVSLQKYLEFCEAYLKYHFPYEFSLVTFDFNPTHPCKLKSEDFKLDIFLHPLINCLKSSESTPEGLSIIR